METNQLGEYKRKLEREQALLLAEIKQSEKPVDFGHETENPDEETDASEEVGNQMAVVEDLKRRLEEVNAALGKMRAGTYGTCEECGKEIETAILDIDPESRFCKNCKSGK